MKKFTYFFYGGIPKPEELQKNMQEWGAYIGGLIQKGIRESGMPLLPKSMVISGRNREVAASEDHGDRVNGYLVVKANNWDEAVKFAEGCPIFSYGGSLEIRELNEQVKGDVVGKM